MLLVAGIAVLTMSIFVFSGWGERLARPAYYELRQECYRVIDVAQLWYAKPAAYGGGERSFIGLDFRKVGMAADSGATSYRGKFGVIELRNGVAESFDLHAESPDGWVLEERGIAFDTRPVLQATKGQRD